MHMSEATFKETSSQRLDVLGSSTISSESKILDSPSSGKLPPFPQHMPEKLDERTSKKFC